MALDVVHRLFESVAPIVFRPVDILLKTLFMPPADIVSLNNMHTIIKSLTLKVLITTISSASVVC